jgi:hypothetical protein
MTKQKDRTELLPPSSAINIAWAQTGFFVKNHPESNEIATEAKKHLDDIIEQARKADIAEKAYVNLAVVDIDATMRTIDTIYKGRELNLEENEKLRSAILENIKEDEKFGRDAKDAIKSLPAMAIAAGAGTVTLNEVLESLSLPGWGLWLIGLGFAGAGFIVNGWLKKWYSSRRQKQYIRQDYDRTIYYLQYLNRVQTALIHLYIDIDRVHNRFFGKKYPLDKRESATSVVKNIVLAAMPTLCPEIQPHIKDDIINTDRWTLCEAGIEMVGGCKYWPVNKTPPRLS